MAIYRLIRRREALVYNTPDDHVTRDIREGIAKLGDLRFKVLDSAGLETEAASGSILQRTTSMTANVLARTQFAVFLIDVRSVCILSLNSLQNHKMVNKLGKLWIWHMSQVEKIERVHVTYDKKKKRKNEAYIAKLHMTLVFFFFFCIMWDASVWQASLYPYMLQK